MDDKELRSLIKDEYLQIQSTIEDFDSRALTIKAWSITFSLAGIAVGFAKDGSPYLFLLASISALLFWTLEARWKAFQYAYYYRSKEIEKAYREETTTELAPMQITSSWLVSWQAAAKQRFFSILFWPHVFHPHLFIFLAGIICFILTQMGFIDVSSKSC